MTDEVNRSLPSSDSHSGRENGGRSARREALLADTVVAFPTAIRLFICYTTSLSDETHSCLLFPEQPCLSGKVVTFPTLGEGILMGEMDSSNLILCQLTDSDKGT